MSKIVNYLVQLHLIYFGISLCFDYRSPGRWGKEFPECSGNRQSPISINSAKAVKEYFDAIEFVGYHNLIQRESYFRNDGKSVALQIGPNEEKPYIFGGKLKCFYDLQSFHFHWGLTSDRGSEHHINKQQFSMEMHLVHRNRKYKTMEEAQKNPDGLAVVAIFLDEQDEKNDELNTLVEHVAQLKKYNSSINVQSPIVLSWYLPYDIDHFFTYEGSLTTPPCSEAVTWIIFPDTVGISNRQLNVFRNLQNQNKQQIVDNFRKLQPINERPVYERTLETTPSWHNNNKILY